MPSASRASVVLPRAAGSIADTRKLTWNPTSNMNMRDLSRDDDFLSYLLVEVLGTTDNPLVVHKMDPSRRLPKHDPSEVLRILQRWLLGNRSGMVSSKRVRGAVDALLDLKAVHQYLREKTQAQINAFATHASRYFELYLPSGSIEIAHTSRYSNRTGKAELCILATMPLKVGSTIIELKGSMAVLTEEENEELKRTDRRNTDGGIRRDFSVIHSGHRKKNHLFLGPARFVNHDCDNNCELFREGKYITFRVIKPIKAGEEITAHYGDGYFGKGNRHCLCETCEKRGAGGYNENTDSDSDYSSDSTIPPREGLGQVQKVEMLGEVNERRTRRGVYLTLPDDTTSEEEEDDDDDDDEEELEGDENDEIDEVEVIEEKTVQGSKEEQEEAVIQLSLEGTSQPSGSVSRASSRASSKLSTPPLSSDPISPLSPSNPLPTPDSLSARSHSEVSPETYHAHNTEGRKSPSKQTPQCPSSSKDSLDVPRSHLTTPRSHKILSLSQHNLISSRISSTPDASQPVNKQLKSPPLTEETSSLSDEHQATEATTTTTTVPEPRRRSSRFIGQGSEPPELDVSSTRLTESPSTRSRTIARSRKTSENSLRSKSSTSLRPSVVNERAPSSTPITEQQRSLRSRASRSSLIASSSRNQTPNQSRASKTPANDQKNSHINDRSSPAPKSKAAPKKGKQATQRVCVTCSAALPAKTGTSAKPDKSSSASQKPECARCTRHRAIFTTAWPKRLIIPISRSPTPDTEPEDHNHSRRASKSSRDPDRELDERPTKRRRTDKPEIKRPSAWFTVPNGNPPRIRVRRSKDGRGIVKKVNGQWVRFRTRNSTTLRKVKETLAKAEREASQKQALAAAATSSPSSGPRDRRKNRNSDGEGDVDNDGHAGRDKRVQGGGTRSSPLKRPRDEPPLEGINLKRLRKSRSIQKAAARAPPLASVNGFRRTPNAMALRSWLTVGSDEDLVSDEERGDQSDSDEEEALSDEESLPHQSPTKSNSKLSVMSLANICHNPEDSVVELGTLIGPPIAGGVGPQYYMKTRRSVAFKEPIIDLTSHSSIEMPARKDGTYLKAPVSYATTKPPQRSLINRGEPSSSSHRQPIVDSTDDASKHRAFHIEPWLLRKTNRKDVTIPDETYFDPDEDRVPMLLPPMSLEFFRAFSCRFRRRRWRVQSREEINSWSFHQPFDLDSWENDNMNTSSSDNGLPQRTIPAAYQLNPEPTSDDDDDESSPITLPDDTPPRTPPPGIDISTLPQPPSPVQWKDNTCTLSSHLPPSLGSRVFLNPSQEKMAIAVLLNPVNWDNDLGDYSD